MKDTTTSISRKITLITGGQRSGKSTFAEKMALELSETPIYIATSRIWDEEHKQRVELHRQRRGNEWTTIEEEKLLSNHTIEGRVVLIDCITLWATNYYFDLKADVSHSLLLLKKEFDAFTSQQAHFIFVTNEIGMGEMSANKIQRQFADLLGWFNQYVASKADEVYLCSVGIPLRIK